MNVLLFLRIICNFYTVLTTNTMWQSKTNNTTIQVFMFRLCKFDCVTYRSSLSASLFWVLTRMSSFKSFDSTYEIPWLHTIFCVDTLLTIRLWEKMIITSSKTELIPMILVVWKIFSININRKYWNIFNTFLPQKMIPPLQQQFVKCLKNKNS